MRGDSEEKDKIYGGVVGEKIKICEGVRKIFHSVPLRISNGIAVIEPPYTGQCLHVYSLLHWHLFLFVTCDLYGRSSVLNGNQNHDTHTLVHDCPCSLFGLRSISSSLHTQTVASATVCLREWSLFTAGGRWNSEKRLHYTELYG